MIEQQLAHIQSRLDEIYDRVASVQTEVHTLKWKVASISSAVGGIFGFISAILARKFM